MKLGRTVSVETTPERLWELLTDTNQLKRWMLELVDDRPLEEGPARVGTRTRMIIREGSKEVEYGSEITQWEPHRLLAIRLTEGSLGSCPMDVTYEVTPQAKGGLSLRYEVEWSPRGILLHLMFPLIVIMGRRNARKTLSRLKELAESNSPTPTPGR